MEILIFGSISSKNKYAITLPIKDDEDLNRVKEVLEPLGFTFRFPKR